MLKFRHRLFLIMLAVFLVFTDVAAYILISQSFSQSMEREKKRALSEEQIIAQSVAVAIQGADATWMNIVMLRYFSYYSEQGVGLALLLNGKTIASNVDNTDITALIPQDKERLTKVDTLGKKPLLLIGDNIGKGLTLVYVRNISDLYAMRRQLSFLLLGISLVASVALAFLSTILARILMRPVQRLEEAAKQFAQGDYCVSLPTDSTDEVGQLACSFEQMAQSVRSREADLAEQARRKQEFIDSLSHEMRTPLTSVVGFARYIQTANASDEQRHRALGHIIDEASRLQDMADKLMRLTLLEHEELTMKPIDAKNFLRKLTEGLKPVLEQKGVQLEITFERVTIIADETLLSVAVRNLVVNAANASNKGDKVTLSIYGDPPVIEVSDRGCGMTEQQMVRAFEPFWRADKSRARKTGGAGLGLCLSQRIAQAHGAFIKLQAREGGGMSARIEFTPPLQICDETETKCSYDVDRGEKT